MQNKLVDWINEYISEWKDHRDSNYLEKWKEYERLWRGVWAAEDNTRSSERSRVTSPALQQAIENSAAEIEEAVFGQGANLFDIEDDMLDQQKADIEFVKNYIKEQFKQNKIRKSVADVILLGAIYGTGIGEVVTKKVKKKRPTTQPMPDLQAVAIGVEDYESVMVALKPISPQNFIIDPNATSIEEAMGVAIEEFVPAHIIAQKIKEGTYKDPSDMGDDAPPNENLEASWVDQEYNDDKIRVVRYYGLVPKKLLESGGEEEEVVELFKKEDEDEEEQSELLEEYGDMVEAIVVIGNDKLLKADKSPFMMQDRPVIAYQHDTVPNRFWGRGVGEKGYNMQKMIDAQMRSYMDGLALTSVPMMAMDATRLPRGSKFEVRPGKTILTNGNPGEILMPFKFGNTDTSNIETAARFEQMLAQATGTMDTSLMQTGSAGGGEFGLTLAPIIKKNKRTLINFQEQFLIPLIEKSAWRYMQFDPENFPVADYNFVPTGTLGMLAREVEQLQLINLLKTLGPDTPITPILIMGVIQNSSLPNRMELLAQMQQAMQPDPQSQQMQQMAQVIQVKTAEAQIADLTASAQEKTARAQKTLVEANLAPEEVKAKMVSALSTNLSETPDDKAFKKRVDIANLMLKEKDLEIKAQDLAQNKEIVNMQMQNT
jgi:hypothetical protein